MKLCKPQYLADRKIYQSEINDGFRCEVSIENGVINPPMDSFLSTHKASLTQIIIQNTKGWFTKPLQESWLLEKIQIQFPTDMPKEFEGNLIWEAKQLLISKEQFIFLMELVEKKETQKIMIEFPEEEVEKIKVRHKTREELKQQVLRERQRAGRALFRAERLTQEYCQLYGDETDWEESDEDSIN